MGWALKPGRNGVCDIVTKGHQDLYLHPLSFSGVMNEANIQPLLEQCRTKRSNLYITDPVAAYAAEEFEVCRLCDKDRNNGVGKRFMADLIAQLLKEGRLVAAETTHGEGIRTATEKELGGRRYYLLDMTIANTDHETVTYTAVFGSVELAKASGLQALDEAGDSPGLLFFLSCVGGMIAVVANIKCKRSGSM